MEDVMEDMVMTPEIEEAIKLINEGKKNIFISGKAGSGKSFFVNYLQRKFSYKNIVVVAPTGIAAINVGGSTIHSFFKMPIGLSSLSAYRNINPKLKKIINNIDILIIDEISMVRADLFDGINLKCRAHNENTIDFGGIQVICIGDLDQLPPVLTNNEKELYNDRYNGLYFYDAKYFNKNNWEMVEFTKIFRQKDEKFIKALNNIRDHNNLEPTLRWLNRRHTEYNGDDATILVPYRNQEKDINEARLKLLKTKMTIFDGLVTGEFKPGSFPVEKDLMLKEKALVMFVTNDIKKRWVNGSTGHVVSFDDHHVTVQMRHGTVLVKRHTFENVEYSVSGKEIIKNVIGTFTQIPLKLAYAMTIHKAQGKTLDTVIVDKGRGMFSSGQLYVALSRCKTYEGLYLSKSLDEDDII